MRRVLAAIMVIAMTIVMGGVSGAATCNSQQTTGPDFTNGADQRTANSGDGNIWSTLSGNDDVDSRDLSDSVCGDGDNDTIVLGADYDVGLGNSGNDRIEGSGGYDDLEGDGGDDVLIGDDGYDELFGDGGSDTLRGGSNDLSNEPLRGGPGLDELYGQAGYDLLIGDDVNDDNWNDICDVGPDGGEKIRC